MKEDSSKTRNFSDSRMQAEELNWELAVNKAIAKLSDALINPSSSIEEIADIVLDHAKVLTQSEHGYVSSIDPETGDNVGHTLTKMMGEQCLISDVEKRIVFSKGADGQYPGLWGYSLNTHKPLYTNRPEQHKASRGIPKGHIPLNNFLSVPAMIGDKVVGQIALANSRSGYTRQHLDAIMHIAKLYAVAIQRKQVEKILRESEERYKRLFEQSPIGISLASAEGKVVAFNKAMEALIGYSDEEFKKINIVDVYDNPEDREALIEAINRYDSVINFPVRLKRKDGTVFDALLTVSRVHFGDKDLLQTICIDVTERKLVEQALQRSERELAIRNKIVEIFLAIPDEEMFGEVLQVILEAMESEYGIFGYIDEHGVLSIPSMTRDVWEKCQVPGKTIVYPREKWGGIWGRALVEKRSLFANEGLHVPEGHIPIKKVLVVPIMYAGQVIGLLEVANKSTDYSRKDQEFLEIIAGKIAPILNARLQRDREERERKQAEEALRESEEKFRSLAETTSDWLWQINKNSIFTYASPKVKDLLGYEPEEVIGKTPFDLMPAEEAKRVRGIFQQVAEERKSFERLENTNLHKDGRLIVLETSGVPIFDAEGDYAGYRGIDRDITERKQAEKDLEKYQQHLEELVQARTEELTEANKQLLQEIEQRKRLEKEILNISERERRWLGQELHDSLGQQLTGIAFMTKVLEQKLTTKSLSEADDIAEVAKLVNQATDQARGLAKGLHPVDLDTGSLMTSLQELATSTERLFGIRCTFKCDKPVPINDTAVAVHLYRITQETITNAIRHGRAKNIQIGLAYGRNKSVLTIKSDGLDFPDKAQAMSTGMGLQIMGHRADIIGGSLDVHRGPEGGTIVTCEFPSKESQQ